MERQVAEQADSLDPRTALMDAAERLLVEVGYAAVTTRKVAQRAGVNHGLVHYYFGSMESLFAETLERFTERVIERQRAMYHAEMPFIEKWRTAMRYMDEDLASGYQKIWLELQAMAWNRPELKERVAHVNAEWRAVLTEAFATAAEHGEVELAELPVGALVSLVMTFNQGMILERHSGIFDGHRDLLSAIDAWLRSMDGGASR